MAKRPIGIAAICVGAFTLTGHNPEHAEKGVKIHFAESCFFFVHRYFWLLRMLASPILCSLRKHEPHLIMRLLHRRILLQSLYDLLNVTAAGKPELHS